MKRKSTFFFLSAFILLSGCSGGGIGDFLVRSFTTSDLTRPDLNQALYDKVMVPGFDQAFQDAQILQTALNAWVANPSTSGLEALKKDFKMALKSWAYTRVLQAGPITSERLPQQVYYWPIREISIVEQLVKMESETTLENAGAIRKGYAVLEYWLYQENLTERVQSEPALVAYLKALTQELLRQITFCQEALALEQERFPKQTQTLNVLLNHMLATLEEVKDQKLGEPLGKKHKGVPQPDLQQASRSDMSLGLIAQNLKGLKTLYLGLNTGFDDYLLALGHRPLNTQIVAQFESLETALAALGDGLRLEADKASLESLYQDLLTLTRLLKVDLANALSETVHFTASDGD